MRAACFVVLMAVLALLSACSERTVSEIVVVLRTDLSVPSEIESFVVDVSGPAEVTQRVIPLTGTNAVAMPVTLTLVNTYRGATPVTVRVSAEGGQAAFLSKQVRTNFLDNAILELPITLERACLEVCCESDTDTVCDAGRCAPAARPGATLASFDPSTLLNEPIVFDCDATGNCSDACVGDACNRSAAVGLGAGLAHTCMIQGQGIACWGNNDAGQLGDGTLTSNPDPVRVRGLSPSTFRTVDGGSDFTCALSESAEVFCWGGNSVGQLGIGSTDPQSMAVGVSFPLPDAGLGAGSGRASLAVGARHACFAIGSEVCCWGDNSNSQLGTGCSSPNSCLSPTCFNHSSTAEVIALAAGDRHTCLLDDASEVFCWGDSSEGQAGAAGGAVANRVDGVSEAVALGLGARHSCAAIGASLEQSDGVVCWGDGSRDQLGDVAGGFGSVDLESVSVLSSEGGEGEFNCALQGGEVSCWGDNRQGQLGRGRSTSTDQTSRPVRVDLGVAAAVAAGARHACALVEGTPWCWGDGASRQLGRRVESDNGAPQPLRCF